MTKFYTINYYPTAIYHVFGIEYDNKMKNDLYYEFSEKTWHRPNPRIPDTLLIECLKFLKPVRGQDKLKLTDFLYFPYFPFYKNRIAVNSKVNEILKQFKIQPVIEKAISFEFKKKRIDDYRVFFFKEIDYLDYKNSKFVFKDITSGEEFPCNEIINDLKEYTKLSRKSKYLVKLIEAKFIQNAYELDIFIYDGSFIISEILKNAIEANNYTGWDFQEFDFFKILCP
jgi:hypothetical protein